MKIGIPRAFEYYKNHVFWRAFFEVLGIELVFSPETDRNILKDGLSLSVDESCLPAKIFLGHTAYLRDKCDCILIPRIESLYKNEKMCTKFQALVDIVKNTLNVNIIDFNIDVRRGLTPRKAYTELGRKLGFSRLKCAAAFRAAQSAQEKADNVTFFSARRLLLSDKLKLLIVGHAYNLHDRLIGRPVFDYLKKAGAEAIAASDFCSSGVKRRSEEISRTLYWTYSKELVGAVQEYGRNADGVILLSAFPCGPDSLVNELLLYKLKNTPVLNLVIDEHQAETGLATRLESFLDILASRRRCAQ